MEKEVLDEAALKAKELLGIKVNLNPNPCNFCGDNRIGNYDYKLNDFVININDGNCYCPKCEKRINPNRIGGRILGLRVQMKMREIKLGK